MEGTTKSIGADFSGQKTTEKVKCRYPPPNKDVPTAGTVPDRRLIVVRTPLILSPGKKSAGKTAHAAPEKNAATGKNVKRKKKRTRNAQTIRKWIEMGISQFRHGSLKNPGQWHNRFLV